MRVASAFFSVALVALAPACAALWGFEDGTLAPPASEAGAGSGADGAIDAAPVDELPDADLTTPVPEGCTTKSIAEAPGVFADPSGSESDACGTEQQPCASLQLALNHAPADAQVLYVGVGEYHENVVVPVDLLARGFRIEGRWQRDESGQWLPFCVPGVDSAVLIGGRDDAATLRAELPDPDGGMLDVGDAGAPDADAGAPATLVLSSLLLRGAEVIPARSSYALFAANISVELRASSLAAARGGDGAPGDVGPAGQGADRCGSGTPGAPGGPAPYGVFERTGWTDSSADLAQPATPGAAGRCASDWCKNGGRGGAPGGTGHVGGASIAVYAWNSQLRLSDGSALHSIGGGVGGNGGPGGEGADGQGGCLSNPGGKGGAGGQGSPGAGGPSHCVVLLAGSALQGSLPADRCSLGAPGLGGDNNKGLSGASKAVFSP